MGRAVKIRRYTEDDIDAVYAAVMESHAELCQWMPWCHENYGREDASAWVLGRPEAWERREEWSHVIVDFNGNLLGGCGIHRIDELHGVGELGYWVRTSATGHGVATAATRTLCDWAFREAGLHRIEILVATNNRASRRVAEKAGGQREGILRERIQLHGKRHDCVLYAMLNS